MSDLEYKSNSHKSKEESSIETTSSEKKEVKKVVEGKVIQKKKSGLKKAADNLSEDGKKVKQYVLFDVLIPAVKKAISDIVTNGIDMLLYGETRSERRTGVTNYVSYNRAYDRVRDRDDRRAVRSTYSFDDVILDRKSDADDVLDAMNDIIDHYGVVSVADYYDLVGITENYTDNKYGWTSLRSAEVVRVRDGYSIRLPKAMVID